MKRVVIVGGGISGLATAYYLRRARPDLQITLLEANERPGGVITTLRRDGFVIEGGPDSFLIQKPWALDLCRELGIESHLVPPEAVSRRVYVLLGSRLKPIPPGMLSGAPTQWGPFLGSRLLSWPGKLRAGMDLFLPRKEGTEDESLGSFIRRRLGEEVLHRIADPILGGIYATTADRLSLLATFPRLKELETKHRSLILGLRREAASSAGPSGSPFRTLPGGMDELVTSLHKALEAVEVRTGCRVVEAAPGRGVLMSHSGVEAQGIVLAMPPPAAAPLLQKSCPTVAKAIRAIPAVSTINVSLAYRDPHPSVGLDASGFVIARGEDRKILACTWSSRKFAGRAPDGFLLVRCYLRGEGGDEILRETDESLARMAREELAAIMGLKEKPTLAAVYRWPQANPILEVGHSLRFERIQKELESTPGLFLTGAGYRGVGIPDCIRDAKETAAEVAKEI